MTKEMKIFTVILLLIIFICPIITNNIKEKNNTSREIEATSTKNIDEIAELQKEKFDMIKNIKEKKDSIEEDVDPLLDSNVKINKRIEDYLGEDLNNIGFIYYNFDTQEKIAYNEDKLFEAASTYKVGLNVVAYDMVEKGYISLNDQVYYNSSQFQEGTGVLQYEENLSSVQLQTLLDYSIQCSDNIAATMIFDYVGGWVNYRSKLFDLLDIQSGSYENLTTANNELKVLQYIYDNRSNENYQRLINDMKTTVFHERLDKYIPQEEVAHKVGDYEYAANDIGIVFTDKPYVIIMLTDDVIDADEKIATVSKMLYYYNKN